MVVSSSLALRDAADDEGGAGLSRLSAICRPNFKPHAPADALTAERRRSACEQVERDGLAHLEIPPRVRMDAVAIERRKNEVGARRIAHDAVEIDDAVERPPGANPVVDLAADGGLPVVPARVGSGC